MNETAIEWLFNQLWNTDKDKLNWHSLLSRAKEIEKEQIIKSFEAGQKESALGFFIKYGEKYYKDNYGA